MIRTRQDAQNHSTAGTGPYILALSTEELQLISALIVMCRLGHGTYETAAMNISNLVEQVSGIDDFGLEALMDVSPSFSIRDPLTLDVIAEYDEDYVIEINV